MKTPNNFLTILGGVYTNLRSMVMVFGHAFRKRDTIQYPEVKPYVPPRYRGQAALAESVLADDVLAELA